jgi:hypothetical protein
MLIETRIAYAPELKPGQEVLYGDLRAFYYDLVDMHELTPKIQEVMEFQRTSKFWKNLSQNKFS